MHLSANDNSVRSTSNCCATSAVFPHGVCGHLYSPASDEHYALTSSPRAKLVIPECWRIEPSFNTPPTDASRDGTRCLCKSNLAEFRIRICNPACLCCTPVATYRASLLLLLPIRPLSIVFEFKGSCVSISEHTLGPVLQITANCESLIA